MDGRKKRKKVAGTEEGRCERERTEGQEGLNKEINKVNSKRMERKKRKQTKKGRKRRSLFLFLELLCNLYAIS